MARVVFISNAGEAGEALLEALAADPALSVFAVLEDVARLSTLGGDCAVNVVVLHQRAPDSGARETAQRFASARGAAVVVVGGDPREFGGSLAVRGRIKKAAQACAPRPAPGGPIRTARATGGKPIRLIAIGSSTGGVEALVEIMRRFPADTPPTVIVQHMPQNFTTSFAARLDSLCAARVEEAWDGAPLEQGRIYLAPGGPCHLEVQWTPARRVRLSPTEPVNRHRPSVDVAFASIVRQQVPGVVGVLLTGMGRDGAEGLRMIRDAGGRTIAQDRDTSTVYGMPRAAMEVGAVDRGTPLTEIAHAIFIPEHLAKEAI